MSTPTLVEPPAGLAGPDGAPVVDLNAWAQLDPGWSATSTGRSRHGVRTTEADFADPAPLPGMRVDRPGVAIDD